MIQLVYSPAWFYGKDIIIDIISIVVLLLVSLAGFRYYLMSRNKKMLYLVLSFSLLALAFLAPEGDWIVLVEHASSKNELTV
ncbi:MAG: hypothetical protein HGA85_04055, partial [Nanoarchaeota archaeon]|nr:hypothetical protein [Nanoarchaeota archaeon]